MSHVCLMSGQIMYVRRAQSQGTTKYGRVESHPGAEPNTLGRRCNATHPPIIIPRQYLSLPLTHHELDFTQCETCRDEDPGLSLTILNDVPIIGFY